MRTRVGNWIFAVGGNRDAARMIGVPANATKIGLFMAVAFCGWVHGQVVLMQTNRANVIEGVGQEFYFIIAAVLGGCLLTGGFGSIVGAALGCLILGMTQQGIPLAGWDNNLYFLFLGVILLAAAFANEWIRRWGRTASRPPTPPAAAPRPTPPPRRRREVSDGRAARAAAGVEVLRQHHRPAEHHDERQGRRGDVRARRQRRRQVDVHQDPRRRAPPRRRATS